MPWGKIKPTDENWANTSAATNKPKIETVAIIGAGIAGVMLGHKLKKRGLKVSLIDKHGQTAQETSANPAALISPKLALGNDAYDRLLSYSFLHALNHYNRLDNIWLKPRGLLHLPHDAKAQAMQQKTSKHFSEVAGWQGLFEDKSQAEISKKFGLKSQYGGMYFPTAGSIDTKELINHLSAGLATIKAHISQISHDGEVWTLSDDEGLIAQAQALVIAGGLDSYNLLAGEENPFTANRGQISYIEDVEFDDGLPSISFGHYLTAPFVGEGGKKLRIIGASHKRISNDDQWQQFEAADEESQLSALNNITGGNHQACGYKIGLRATTIDHMPIVGQAATTSGIKNLPKHRQKMFPNQLNANQRQEGLYMLTGLGARGYQLAPLLSEILLSHILSEPLPVDSDILNAIDPARFMLRQRRHEKL